MPNTLLSPFSVASSAPALLLPASSPTPNVVISYAELSGLVESFRADLARHTSFRVGDVVSMSLINGAEFSAAFLGVTAHRCVAAPLNPAYNEAEVSFYLSDTASKLVVVPAGATSSSPLHPAVMAARALKIPCVEIVFDGKKIVLSWDRDQGKINGRPEIPLSGSPQESDVALVLHTSGTTGRPKAVPLSHVNLYTTMQNVINTYSLSPADRTYLVMPLFHVHGLLAGFLGPLLSGGSVVVTPKFSAGVFWNEFVAAKANWYTAVPTIHQILLRSPHPSPVPQIRFIRSCSSALSPTTLEEVEKAFKAPVLEAYAMTEASHQMTSNPLPPLVHKAGTVGLPQGISLRILSLTTDEQVEEGEVAIKGANVTLGYLNNPKANRESFTADGYFRTGDRGKLDADGFLILTGRLKELINRGGEKISPLEVDAALLSVQGVAEAVCFGVPDEKYGEKVWAAVVLKTGTSAGEKELIKGVKEKVSAFKCPERIFILEAIPKTATGKIQRKAISERFVKQVAAEQGAAPKAKL